MTFVSYGHLHCKTSINEPCPTYFCIGAGNRLSLVSPCLQQQNSDHVRLTQLLIGYIQEEVFMYVRTCRSARKWMCVRAYICICTYVCMYVYVCVCVWVHGWKDRCTHGCQRACIYIYIFIYLFTYACVCVYVCMYVYVLRIKFSLAPFVPGSTLVAATHSS
jgi:hypothetical protein